VACFPSKGKAFEKENRTAYQRTGTIKEYGEKIMFQISSFKDVLVIFSKVILEFLILGIILHVSSEVIIDQFVLPVFNPSVFGWGFLSIFVRLFRRIIFKDVTIPFLKY